MTVIPQDLPHRSSDGDTPLVRWQKAGRPRPPLDEAVAQRCVQAIGRIMRDGHPAHEPPQPEIEVVPEPEPPAPVLSPLAQRITDALRSGKPRETTTVYFVRCLEFVKVGFSSMPRLRIQGLAAMTPLNIQILKIVKSSPAGERAVHACLAEFHHRFEWFHLKPELLAAIAELKGNRIPKSWEPPQ